MGNRPSWPSRASLRRGDGLRTRPSFAKAESAGSAALPWTDLKIICFHAQDFRPITQQAEGSSCVLSDGDRRREVSCASYKQMLPTAPLSQDSASSRAQLAGPGPVRGAKDIWEVLGGPGGLEEPRGAVRSLGEARSRGCRHASWLWAGGL